MERTTVMIPEDLRRQGMRQARAMGLSFGELVRSSLRDFLSSPRKKAKTRDTLFLDHSVYEGDVPEDLSLHHDDYLYGETE